MGTTFISSCVKIWSKAGNRQKPTSSEEKLLKTLSAYGIIKQSRKGIVDVWHAFMTEGTDFCTNTHDIPF